MKLRKNSHIIAIGLVLAAVLFIMALAWLTGCSDVPQNPVGDFSPSATGWVTRMTPNDPLPISKTCVSASGSTTVRTLKCTFTRPALPGESIKCSLIFDSPILMDSGSNSYMHEPAYYSENIAQPAATVTMILPHPQNFVQMICGVLKEKP